MVFAHTDDTIILIVDRHFWKVQEKNTDLAFVRQDFQASNSSEQWTQSNFVYAFPLIDGNGGLRLYQESEEDPPVGIKLLNK